MCPSRFFKIASLIRSANFFLWTFFQTFRDLFKVYMMGYSLPLPSSFPRSCVNCNGTITSEIQEEKREAYCTGARIIGAAIEFSHNIQVGIFALPKFEKKLDRL